MSDNNAMSLLREVLKALGHEDEKASSIMQFNQVLKDFTLRNTDEVIQESNEYESPYNKGENAEKIKDHQNQKLKAFKAVQERMREVIDDLDVGTENTHVGMAIAMSFLACLNETEKSDRVDVLEVMNGLAIGLQLQIVTLERPEIMEAVPLLLQEITNGGTTAFSVMLRRTVDLYEILEGTKN